MCRIIPGGDAPHRHELTTEEEKRIIHEVFKREVYSHRQYVIAFARMGSKKCRRIALQKGWAKPGMWRDDFLFGSTKEQQRKKKNATHRKWYAEHKEEMREYRRKLKERKKKDDC